MVDAHDSKSCSAMSEGSSPSSGTFEKSALLGDFSYVPERKHLRASVRDLKDFSISSLRDRKVPAEVIGKTLLRHKMTTQIWKHLCCFILQPEEGLERRSQYFVSRQSGESGSRKFPSGDEEIIRGQVLAHQGVLTLQGSSPSSFAQYLPYCPLFLP